MTTPKSKVPIPEDPKVQKLLAGLENEKNLDVKVEKIIWANVLFNAGMGAVPLGINIWTFIGANVAMITALGHLYGYTMSKEQAGALIKQIFTAVGVTWAATYFGLKFFAEVLKGVGVFAMGAPTVAGMALDAVLGGAISYALGYTGKMYFANNRNLGSKQTREEFRARFTEGKGKVQRAVKDKKTTSS